MSPSKTDNRVWEEPFQQIRQLLSDAEGAEKKVLLREIFEIVVNTETPEETAMRIALYPLQSAIAKIGHDLKIFQTLVKKGPSTLEQLQKQTNAHPLTLGRILRYMASVGFVHETGVDQFEASKKGQKLADPAAITITTHFFENCAPLFQHMPAFLHSNHYDDVTDGTNTVFQKAYQTSLDTYSWFSEHPENKKALIDYMAMEQSVRSRWLEQYPFEREASNWKADRPVFVDIGGNVGVYCALFKNRCASIPGRVILQDLPSTLTHALSTPGVETMGHDFFKPQPVKHAKYYHLGWVLHNWNDEKCKAILTQIKTAMNHESSLLINDMVLPAKSVPSYSAALDLVMLGACGSRERREEEWQSMLKEVGLKIKDCIVYDEALCHGILVATLP